MPERNITDRLAAGETLLLDGGTGSELQRRGADVLKGATGRLEAWSATANIEFADVVRQVHQDYLRVGADVITSNNFWTIPSRLKGIGLAGADVPDEPRGRCALRRGTPYRGPMGP